MVLRGTRTPVKALFENLEAGLTIDEVIEQFPVSREQLDSLMAFCGAFSRQGPDVYVDRRRRASGLEVMLPQEFRMAMDIPRALARFRAVRPAHAGDVSLSIKVRVVSGCFH